MSTLLVAVRDKIHISQINREHHRVVAYVGVISQVSGEGCSSNIVTNPEEKIEMLLGCEAMFKM